MTTNQDRAPVPAELLIGEFAARCGLSAKALRLYDELGLLKPIRVDARTGYRYYDPGQTGRARRVALLRHLDMPLAEISGVLALAPAPAAAAVRAYWRGREDDLCQRGRVVEYVCALFSREETAMEPQHQPETAADHEVTLREVPERVVLSAVRHVHESEAAALLGGLLGRMSQAGPGLAGLDGCPHTTYHGAVSSDSDGPVEIVRPMADLATAREAASRLGDVEARVEPAHTEAVVRLTMSQAGWPAMLPALDALETYLAGIGREPAAPPRQVMIADWRTAAPDDPACLLSVPLAREGGNT